MRAYPQPVPLEFVRGDATGLYIPAHAGALRETGEEFLTQAFHAFGTLSRDNRIVRISRFEPFGGGNSGHKVSFSVEYAHPEPGLHTNLFVKFSRDFDDAFRDRRKYELEGEVRLARLTRLPNFPVPVPAPLFADFHHESGTGLVIMEEIAFGTGAVEPLREKCMDHELPDPRLYYRPIFTALAKLVAGHKSGILSPQVDQFFPFNAEAAAAALPIPYTEKELLEQIGHFADFVALCPQLLPPNIANADFIARLEREAPRFLQHEKAIMRFLHADPDFVALSHWNGNIDNAWFWREPDGTLGCGLLDWGMVRQMNVTWSLWSSLSMTTLEVWNNHLDELLMLFITTLQDHGGPRLDRDLFELHLHLSVAMIGLALTMEAPTLVISRLPEAAHASGILDPVLRKDSVVRGFLQVYVAFLNLWETRDFGASLDDLLQRLES